MAMNPWVRELRSGLAERQYRKIHCKICGRELGVAHKRWFGLVLYCPLCIAEYQP